MLYLVIVVGKVCIYVKVLHSELLMLALKVLLGDENSLYVTVCQRVLVDYFWRYLSRRRIFHVHTTEESLVDLLAVWLWDQPVKAVSN